MTNVEKISISIILLGVGIAAGMLYEHQRFIREVQGLRTEHAKTPPPPASPDPQPEVAA